MHGSVQTAHDQEAKQLYSPNFSCYPFGSPFSLLCLQPRSFKKQIIPVEFRFSNFRPTAECLRASPIRCESFTCLSGT